MSQTPISTPKKRNIGDLVQPKLIERRSSIVMRTENFCEVKLSDDCDKITKTPEFQRLRRISQLGTAQYIFPSATHTRFEHSLGVSQLAQIMVHNMNITQIYSKGVEKDDLITTEDAKMIEMAALCHDLGHGPFSHLYERMMERRGIKFEHEKQSTKLFKKIVDENQIDLTNDEIKIIDSIITNEGTILKPWRRQIVSNDENGIDVDRLDYIRRDSHHLNRPIKFNVENIIKGCSIVQNNICFLQDIKSDIEDFFTNRYQLYKEVYTNKDVTSVELLFTDILNESYDYIPLLKSDPSDLEKYIQLDDSIVNLVRFSNLPELSKAKDLIRKVDRGEFYPIVSVIKETEENRHTLMNLTPENISACGNGLVPEDIIVDNQKILVAREDNWDKIPFILSGESKHFFFKSPSILYPKENKTHCKRIFTRNPNKLDEVRDAVDSFVKNYDLGQSIVME